MYRRRKIREYICQKRELSTFKFHIFHLLNPSNSLSILPRTQTFKAVLFSPTFPECHSLKRAQPFSSSLVYTHPSWLNMIFFSLCVQKNQKHPFTSALFLWLWGDFRVHYQQRNDTDFIWLLEKSRKMLLTLCMTICSLRWMYFVYIISSDRGLQWNNCKILQTINSLKIAIGSEYKLQCIRNKPVAWVGTKCFSFIFRNLVLPSVNNRLGLTCWKATLQRRT